jgi:alpha-galactosidase
LAVKRHLKPSADYKIVPAVRDANGNILPRAEFANMKGLTDYIHSEGLKAGLYSSPGPLTCGCGIGSWGYEVQDADIYAKWGFDFLKYDWCSYGYIRNDNNLPVQQHIDTFKLMSDALKKQNRDIVFNFCQYGIADVWKWGHKAGGHSWRVDSDLGCRIENHAIYCNLLGIASGMAAIADYQKPGRWNDPDYIMIGDRWHLSPSEKYSYMTFWTIWASPLFYSADIANLDDFTLNILCNPEIIAVNQDILGLQGKRIIMEDDYQVWVKPLGDKSLAVALFNTGESDIRIKLTWSELGLKGKQKIRDLWRQNDIGVLDTAFEMKVSRHSAEMVRFISSGRD